MIRLWTKISDGSPGDGSWYAGDVNQLQDAVAAITDLAQVLSVGELRVGESGIALVRYGSGDARLTSRLRIDGILRALGGLYIGSFSDSAIAAVTAADKPFGTVIENSTRGRFEWNVGSGASPLWYPIACDVNGDLVMPPGGSIFIDGDDITTLIAPYPTEIALASWPPGSPSDKDEHYLRINSTLLWHVRYDTGIGDGYKWDVLGNTPVYVQRGSAGVSGASATNASDGALSAVAPRLGIYDVDHGFSAVGISPSTYVSAYCAGSQIWAGFSAEENPKPGSSSARVFEYELGTGATVTQQYAVEKVGGGTGSASVSGRFVSLTPRRIG